MKFPPALSTSSHTNLIPYVHFQAPGQLLGGLYQQPQTGGFTPQVQQCTPQTRLSVITTTLLLPTTIAVTRTRALPTTIFTQLVQTTFIPTTFYETQIQTSVIAPVIQTTTEVSS